MKYAHAAVFMLLAAVAVEAVILMGTEELKMRDINMLENDIVNVSCIEFADGELCSVPDINGTDTVWNITDSVYLINDSGVLDVDETVLNASITLHLKTIIYNASSVNATAGTHDYGDLDSIHTARDDNEYNVTEDSGADPLTIVVNFTGVNTFDLIDMRGKYTGGVGHEIKIGVQLCADGSYEEEYGELTDQADYEYTPIPVRDASVHVCDGNVSVRLRHVQNGIPSHEYSLDYMVLIEGFAAISNIDHDGLSGRDSWTNHPQYTEAIYNLTLNVSVLQAGDVWTQSPQITSKRSVGGGSVNITGNLTIEDQGAFSHWFIKGQSVVEVDSDPGQPVGLYYVPEGNGSLGAFLSVRNKADTTRGRGFTLWAAESPSRVFFPFSHKEYDLGKVGKSWNDCYCDDYVTTSKGWLSSSTSAVDIVSLINTKEDGEVDHATVDKSLEGDSGYGTLSLNALTIANSNAIRELNAKILLLEEKLK